MSTVERGGVSGDAQLNACQTVLVIGGTRGTGLLIARLLRELRFPVRVLARDPVRARTLFDASTEIVHGDITRPETPFKALKDSHHIVFTAGCRSSRPLGEHVERTDDSIVLDVCIEHVEGEHAGLA